MKHMYGAAFLSAYGDAPNQLWEATISRLTDDECRAGLSRLAKEAREYPVNLTQFMEACRPKKSARYLGVPTTPDELRKLEPPKANPDHVSAVLERMRRRLA